MVYEMLKTRFNLIKKKEKESRILVYTYVINLCQPDEVSFYSAYK